MVEHYHDRFASIVARASTAHLGGLIDGLGFTKCGDFRDTIHNLVQIARMAERTDPAAELRELCTSFAIQAGARKASEIVDLAEALRAYIQLGPEVIQKQGASHAGGNTTRLTVAGGLRPEQLHAENDG